MKTIVMAALLTLAPLAALAQQDKAADRAQRRAQMQLMAVQQQLQEAQAARSKAEAERAEVAKRQQEDAAALAKAASAQRRLGNEVKTVLSERAALTARVAELEHQLAEQKRAGEDALGAKDRELAQAGRQARQREEEQAQLQGRFAEQVRMVTECTDKNERLGRLGVELIERYRRKGVADAIVQREPLLGLGEVQTFNLLQEYRDRVDAERSKPSVSR